MASPEFFADTLVEPRSPSWTILPEPLQAKATRVSENGVTAIVPNFPLSRYEKWMRHTERGDSIEVALRLYYHNVEFDLTGEIVWVGYAGGEQPIGDCAVGILLSLLTPEKLNEFQRLLRQ